MNVLLVAATEMELRAFLEGAVPKAKAETLARRAASGVPARASLHGREAGLLVCGVGPLNAAYAVGGALERLRRAGRFPAGVLNVGIAGSYDLSVAPIGSLVLVTEEFMPEYGVHVQGEVQTQALGFAQATVNGHGVFDRIGVNGEAALVAMNLGICRNAASGAGVTVNGVSGDAARAESLFARTRALVESMEGFALALGCAQALHRCGASPAFAEIRAVSNRVGKRPPHGWNIPAALDALGVAAERMFALREPSANEGRARK